MKKQWLPWAIPLLMLMLAIGLRVWQPPFMETVKLKGFDAYQMAMPREYQPMPINVIDIDDESLGRLGQWPWPRTQVAEMVQRLTELGVAAIGFDIVFSEPDRTSPSHMAALWEKEGAANLADTLKNLPDHDALLGKAIADAPVVSGFVLTQGGITPKPQGKAGISFIGPDPRALASGFTSSVNSLAPIEKSAKGNGALNATVDADGMIRKVPLVLQLNGKLYPTLSAELLRVAQGASTYLVKTAEGGGMTDVKIGELKVPVDGEGRLWIHYSRHDPARYIPAWQVLQPGYKNETLEGAIVVVGTSAAGLKDLRATPLNPVMPGVEVHVQGMEQILLGHYLERPDWMEGAETLLTLVIGLLLIAVCLRLGAKGGLVMLAVFLGGTIGFGMWAFDSKGMLVDVVYPCVTITMIYIAATLVRFMATEKEKAQVRSAFSHYMSPALVEELAKNPDKLTLGGEMRDMSVLFCDIRGFTTISEQFDASGLTRFINRFLTPMTKVILERRGTIDKYIGDCIMAFWNAPLDDEKHAVHACRSALAMVKACQELDATVRGEFEAEGKKPIPVAIGLGINSGEMCVGNMGSDQRFDYSVLGDEVNLASRLEGQSKTYGVDIVIGESTRSRAPMMATIELDLIKVKGKTKPVMIHALLGEETLAEDNGFIQLKNAWDGMLASYRRQDWNDAEHWLHNSARMMEALGLKLDGLVELYAERIAAYRAKGPGKGWDGVFEAKSK
ncbi:CHASE2 domain-containing protein [bacterium]|nr:CHASE2 domain-containing protein [bacterium]